MIIRTNVTVPTAKIVKPSVIKETKPVVVKTTTKKKNAVLVQPVVETPTAKTLPAINLDEWLKDDIDE